MNPKELKEYIDEKAPNAYETFFASAKEYQNEKNQKRQPAKRWNERKVDRSVEKMWAGVISTIHNSLSMNIKGEDRKNYEAWVEFIEKSEFLVSFEEQIAEIEFE